MRVIRVLVRWARIPWAILSIFAMIFLVIRIVASILWFLGTLPAAHHIAVWRFRGRLRRSGIERDAADEIVACYARGLSIVGRDRTDEAARRA